MHAYLPTALSTTPRVSRRSPNNEASKLKSNSARQKLLLVQIFNAQQLFVFTGAEDNFMIVSCLPGFMQMRPGN